MSKILLVTGNAHKLAEWQRMMPPMVTLESIDIDLIEIQSDDPLEIVSDKAERAYEAAGIPVIIEDVSAGLVKFNGLPGPFVKFFIKQLGQDALYKLAGDQEAEAVVSCTAAYYDGTDLLVVKGNVHGTVVAPRPGSTFGFDVTFVPDGHAKTYSEMTATEKDAVRSVACDLDVASRAAKPRIIKLNFYFPLDSDTTALIVVAMITVPKT